MPWSPASRQSRTSTRGCSWVPGTQWDHSRCSTSWDSTPPTRSPRSCSRNIGEAIRASAIAQAHGAGGNARQEVRQGLLRLLLEPTSHQRAGIVSLPNFRGYFREDELARAVYSEAAGIGRAIPAAVAVPIDAEDVVALLKWGAETGPGLIPRGSGSSMSGGAIGTGVVVDLSRINHLARIDERDQSVWVEPGVVWATLDVAARRKGLHLPADPSSGAFCTLGGMVSTNAAGPHSLKYGSFRPWVNAIDCVFSDGDRAVIVRGEPPPKHVAAINRFMKDVH